jgi:hypothetical protein
MRIDTIINEVYKFSELSEKAQQKAIEKIRNDENYLSYDWWHYDGYVDDLEKLGFKDVKIYFSGFWSQGDGACFDAKIDLSNVENLTIQEKRVVKLINEGYIDNFEITKNSYANHYSHENTRKIETNFWTYGGNLISNFSNIEEIYHNLGEKLEKIRYDKCKEIYESLYSQHEYLNSDEAIKEHIESNDLEFYQDGTQY